MTLRKTFTAFALSAGALGLSAGLALADQVFLDDVIVNGSICAGQDCVNGESFGFDTLRLKENNLRIRAVDTSSTSSFPTNDWQITFNDSANGGANKFSIDDIDGGRTPFTIEASARSNALYVENDGDIGFGTTNPVVTLHAVEGNTPTLRLEQDGSSGFTPQTWDVAGNEAGFFVRDATNGSLLSFRIEPSAPASSIHIDAAGNVGLGDSSPDAKLDVQGGNILVEQNGTVSLTLADTSDVDPDVKLQLENGSLRMSYAGTGTPEFELQQNGNMVTTGTCIEFNRGGSSFACTASPGAALTCSAAGTTCP